MNVERYSPITSYQNSTVHFTLQVRPSSHVAAVWGGYDGLHDWSGCVSTAGAQRLADRAQQQTPVMHTTHTAAVLRGTYATRLSRIIAHTTFVFPSIKN